MLDEKLMQQLSEIDAEKMQADEINIGLMRELNERHASFMRTLAKISHYARANHGGGRDGQQRDTVKERQADGSVIKRTVTAHAWTMMKSRNQIDMAQWSAGAAMAADVHRSQIAPIRAASYETIFDSQAQGKGQGWGNEKKPKSMTLDKWYKDRKATTAQVWKPLAAGRVKTANNTVNDGIIDAVDRLVKLRRLVGDKDYELLYAVVVDGDTYARLEMLRANGKRVYGTRKTIAKRVKAAIEKVGVFYGLVKEADEGIRLADVVHYGERSAWQN